MTAAREGWGTGVTRGADTLTECSPNLAASAAVGAPRAAETELGAAKARLADVLEIRGPARAVGRRLQSRNRHNQKGRGDRLGRLESHWAREKKVGAHVEEAAGERVEGMGARGARIEVGAYLFLHAANDTPPECLECPPIVDQP